MDTSNLKGEHCSALLDVQAMVLPEFADRQVDIRDCGAVDDGLTANTDAFRQAIEACSTASGGTVRVPAGTWLTGPIHFKSNVRLHLEQGAVVLFSDRPADYLPVVFTRWEGHECYNYSPLIYANGCENIAITGHGIFDISRRTPSNGAVVFRGPGVGTQYSLLLSRCRPSRNGNRPVRHRGKCRCHDNQCRQ